VRRTSRTSAGPDADSAPTSRGATLEPSAETPSGLCHLHCCRMGASEARARVIVKIDHPGPLVRMTACQARLSIRVGQPPAWSAGTRTAAVVLGAGRSAEPPRARSARFHRSSGWQPRSASTRWPSGRISSTVCGAAVG
jgi:hypothetical protein